MSNEREEALIELIDKYKELECLWKVSSKKYKNRNERLSAMAQLLVILKKTEPTANIETVQKKLNSLKCAFNREYNKVKAAYRSGIGTDDVYIPRLWYYDLLLFLADRDTETRRSINIDDILDETAADSPEDINTNIGTEQDSSHSQSSTIRSVSQPNIQSMTNKSKRKVKNVATEVLTKISNRLDSSVSNSKPILSAFGDHIAEKLRTMQKDMALYCQKIINDAIFQAEFGNLNHTSRIVTDYPRRFQQSCKLPFTQIQSPHHQPLHQPSPTNRIRLPSYQSPPYQPSPTTQIQSPSYQSPPYQPSPTTQIQSPSYQSPPYQPSPTTQIKLPSYQSPPYQPSPTTQIRLPSYQSPPYQPSPTTQIQSPSYQSPPYQPSPTTQIQSPSYQSPPYQPSPTTQIRLPSYQSPPYQPSPTTQIQSPSYQSPPYQPSPTTQIQSPSYQSPPYQPSPTTQIQSPSYQSPPYQPSPTTQIQSPSYQSPPYQPSESIHSPYQSALLDQPSPPAQFQTPPSQDEHQLPHQLTQASESYEYIIVDSSDELLDFSPENFIVVEHPSTSQLNLIEGNASTLNDFLVFNPKSNKHK